MEWDEIHYRWERCDPVDGVAFFPNDVAIVRDHAGVEMPARIVGLRAADPEPEYEVDVAGKRLVRRQSDLTSSIPQDTADSVAWIQKWYAGQCDGDWEHQNGLSISTLDNPGWSVTIDLDGTELAAAQFAEVASLDPPRMWLSCKVVANRWEGRGGPHMLGEILATFVRWARRYPQSD